MRTGILLAVAIVLLVGGGMVLARLGGPEPRRQPIAFSHAIHVQGQELECRDCHEDAWTKPYAGFPSTRSCADCHREAEGDHPDEPKVREYAKRQEEIPWVQVNRNPGHVYFSHRAHVTFAEMSCESCHGDVASRDEPITIPTEELHSMDHCMDCHREREASLECMACHK